MPTVKPLEVCLIGAWFTSNPGGCSADQPARDAAALDGLVVAEEPGEGVEDGAGAGDAHCATPIMRTDPSSTKSVQWPRTLTSWYVYVSCSSRIPCLTVNSTVTATVRAASYRDFAIRYPNTNSKLAQSIATTGL